ncbi:hypothetical protein BT96DRAFT_1006219 [Gymnopus androsaceus JB14]|uniref:Uncharacterized protein n=1 Tax=Gymnopus androsaceus JB14 TaxID=1447944 RepID=A0A6A4GM63_9AGAR|nr:hypothetical protein BT96DRAFT_1006219 [Gymnopus androsaceus JB14]
MTLLIQPASTISAQPTLLNAQSNPLTEPDLDNTVLVGAVPGETSDIDFSIFNDLMQPKLAQLRNNSLNTGSKPFKQGNFIQNAGQDGIVTSSSTSTPCSPGIDVSVTAQSLALLAPLPHDSAQTIPLDDSSITMSSHAPAFLVNLNTDVAQGDFGTSMSSHAPAFLVDLNADVVQGDFGTSMSSHAPAFPVNVVQAASRAAFLKKVVFYLSNSQVNS